MLLAVQLPLVLLGVQLPLVLLAVLPTAGQSFAEPALRASGYHYGKNPSPEIGTPTWPRELPPRLFSKPAITSMA